MRVQKIFSQIMVLKLIYHYQSDIQDESTLSAEDLDNETISSGQSKLPQITPDFLQSLGLRSFDMNQYDVSPKIPSSCQGKHYLTSLDL